jgi:hypothetical protein
VHRSGWGGVHHRLQPCAIKNRPQSTSCRKGTALQYSQDREERDPHKAREENGRHEYSQTQSASQGEGEQRAATIGAVRPRARGGFNAPGLCGYALVKMPGCNLFLVLFSLPFFFSFFSFFSSFPLTFFPSLTLRSSACLAWLCFDMISILAFLSHCCHRYSPRFSHIAVIAALPVIRFSPYAQLSFPRPGSLYSFSLLSEFCSIPLVHSAQIFSVAYNLLSPLQSIMPVIITHASLHMHAVQDEKSLDKSHLKQAQ